MAKKMVVVRFNGALQESQNIGGDEHLVATLFFEIEVEEEHWKELSVRVKQVVGDDYEGEGGRLEVGPIEGSYDGPMDYSQFRACAEECYRAQVAGSGASGIRTEGGGSIDMLNNRFGFRHECRFSVTPASEAW